MLTYDIVYDILYAHTISYITDIRHSMYLQTYDIVYVMDSLCSTISYVIHTTSHVDIRYRKNIRYRTYDIVCPTMQYRIYDIVYTIWYTTSNTGHTISYVQTYDIVGDIRYRMWQKNPDVGLKVCTMFVLVHTHTDPTHTSFQAPSPLLPSACVSDMANRGAGW